MKKGVIVLGSTGSIGESTLEVVRGLPDSFEVKGLSCLRGVDRLNAQIGEFRPTAVCIADESLHGGVEEGPRVYEGSAELVRMIEETEAAIVVNGISGAAGLPPSLAAIRSGKDLALANKESMVMAGPFLMAEAARRGRKILPVDSEHAALFGILRGLGKAEVVELILTASGGAFRDLPVEALSSVTYADALKHPTWKMGPKITVDSASMANKGLEIIEAHGLFGVAVEKIKVLIHPQSLVHSLVRTVDGTLHMEASTADMRIPIQNALTFPSVEGNRVERLELAGRDLTFLPVDGERYRMVGLAYDAAALSPSHPIVYNAANEVAVTAFMEGRIPFTGIPRAVERTLCLEWNQNPSGVEEVLSIDASARARTLEIIA